MIDDSDDNNNDDDVQERAHVKIPVEESFEARYVTRLGFDSSGGQKSIRKQLGMNRRGHLRWLGNPY